MTVDLKLRCVVGQGDGVPCRGNLELAYVGHHGRELVLGGVCLSSVDELL
jgi:hypothetical protein